MHDLFGVGSVGDKDTKNALGRFVSRGRWRKGSWVLVGAALTVGSLSERVQVRGRQSVARAPTRSPWTLLRSHCSPCPCWRTQRSRTLPTAPPSPSLLSSRGKNERGPCGTFSLAFLQVRPRSPLVSLSVVRPRSQQVVRTRGPPVKRNRSRLPRASRICFF